MEKQQRIDEVWKYIDKYYVPGNDDIDVEHEQVKGFFDKITEFLVGKREKSDSVQETDSAVDENERYDVEEDKSDSDSDSSYKTSRPEFDLSTAQKIIAVYMNLEVL